MSAVTNIEWTDSTFNAWIGCAKVGPGCDNCYAEALDARYRWGGAAHWGHGVPRRLASPPMWKLPLTWNRLAREKGAPWRVFCSSMADVFDNEVPDGWRVALFDVVRETTALTWQVLTKRIGNARRMLPADWGDAGWDNVWLGATVVNQEEVDRDVPKLRAIPARLRFLSVEPILEAVTLDLRGVGWVIVGGESGPGRREARVEWIRSVADQCSAAGVPVFVKQDSGSRPGRQGRIPEDLWIKRFPGAGSGTSRGAAPGASA